LVFKAKRHWSLGGSKGLGRGVADALAGEGVAVALLARGKEALDHAVAEITARGGRAIGLSADLADWSAVENAANSAHERLGPIDILLNNSGPPPSRVIGVAPEIWEAQFRAMVLVFFRLTDTLLPEMRKRRWGRVLNVASESVMQPIPPDCHLEYVASGRRRMGQNACRRGRSRWHNREHIAAGGLRDRSRSASSARHLCPAGDYDGGNRTTCRSKYSSGSYGQTGRVWSICNVSGEPSGWLYNGISVSLGRRFNSLRLINR
jgi:NAD(P)-dependent dehydrogenase (short-subunit alcohol dehydrogenase family)